jgi:hypothetical protein
LWALRDRIILIRLIGEIAADIADPSVDSADPFCR